MGGMGGDSGEGGSGGDGGSGGSGGMNTGDECDELECGASETCIAGPMCVPTCSTTNSCEIGDACIEARDCPFACTDDSCRPECSPLCEAAETCVEDDDCSSDYCDREDGDAIGVCRPACAETSSCATAEECTRTADCTDGTCEGGVCHPPCGATGTCAPGADCATSADCAGDDLCHAGEHVCLTSCAGRTLASQADFDAVYYCWEIDGDLVLNPVPALATIGEDKLPYLSDITGSFTIAAGATVDSLTMPALSVVLGGFSTGNNYTGELYFNDLHQLGTFGMATTGLTVGLTTATVFYSPKLTTIYGGVYFASLPNLTTLDMRSLAAVHGDFRLEGTGSVVTSVILDTLETRSDINGAITLQQLPNIPWTTFDFILPLNGDEAVSDIGCNTSSTCNCGNTSCVPPP